MLRKFSTRFKSRKEEASRVNGTNGTNGTSGTNGINGTNGTTPGLTSGTNGESRGKANLKERHSSFGPFKLKKETSNHSPDHSASRKDVENSFEQFAQQIHASVRTHSYLFLKRTATESRGILRKRQSFLSLNVLP